MTPFSLFLPFSFDLFPSLPYDPLLSHSLPFRLLPSLHCDPLFCFSSSSFWPPSFSFPFPPGPFLLFSFRGTGSSRTLPFFSIPNLFHCRRLLRFTEGTKTKNQKKKKKKGRRQTYGFLWRAWQNSGRDTAYGPHPKRVEPGLRHPASRTLLPNLGPSRKSTSRFLWHLFKIADCQTVVWK